MPGIFISYRRKDTGGHAGRLADRLIRHYGRSNVFMDIDSIDVGTPFKTRIDKALDSTKVTLVLIGDDWLGQPKGSRGTETSTASRRIDQRDDWVRKEVAAALRRDDVTVVPVLVEGAPMPKRSELPRNLSSLPGIEYCELRNTEWPHDFHKIRKAVDRADTTNRLARWIQRTRILFTEGAGWGRVAAAGAVLAIVAVIVFAVTGGGNGGPARGSGCVNRQVPADTRAALSTAANEKAPAVQGSVYYGTCGAQSFATATFPDGRDGIFKLVGLHWQRLGSIAAKECVAIPDGLLGAWGKASDC
jgi:TIR domain-containing protein